MSPIQPAHDDPRLAPRADVGAARHHAVRVRRVTWVPRPSRDGLWSWVTTVDHERIGKLYLFTAFAFLSVRRRGGGADPRAARRAEHASPLGVGVVVGGAGWWIAALHAWLTTPLEGAA
jgi:hypothetical protein